jgi:hypothetical protein
MTLYDRVITEIFRRHEGATKEEFEFDREEITEVAGEWDEEIKNLGDVLYTYRSGRRELPAEITRTGDWIIEPRGKGRYAFRRVSRASYISCPSDLQTIAMLDATPDIIRKYGGSDEQGLLAKVRYNRLVDTFLGITAYHLQGHVRRYLQGSGQVEIDDLYLGVDKDGHQYVIPVEAKTAHESIGLVQVMSLIEFGREEYPNLVLRPVAVKSWNDDSIFFLEFNGAATVDDIRVVQYRRYRLVRDKRRAREQGLGSEEGD